MVVKSSTFKIAFILIAAFSIRLYFAFDVKLNDWDEKYHALVSKNSWEHPLKPTLYENPILPYDELNWVGNHVWLSKPPLTFWLMGTSIHFFGPTNFAVRFPSILFGSISVLLTFLIAKRIFNENIALLAALLHATHGYLIESGAGKISSDHVDTLFIFLVELGVFLILKLNVSFPKWYHSLLIGFITGLAFLTKWYPAFLILGLYAVFNFRTYNLFWKSFLHLIIATLPATAISLFWVVFIFYNYPIPGQISFKVLNAFNETIESHTDVWYYYLIELMTSINEFVWFAILYFIIKKYYKNSKIELLLIWILIPVLIFSLGTTKRFTYLFIVTPAVMIIVSAFAYHVSNLFKEKNNWIGRLAFILLFILHFRLFFERTKLFQSKSEVPEFYINLEENKKNINSSTVIFGTDYFIEYMFYTDAYAAYRKLPSEEDIHLLKQNGLHHLVIK